MIGHIYIEGQIGSTHKEDGSIDVKGVELQDVISQVRKNAHCEKIMCHITSQGGLVHVGKAIAEYCSSIHNLYMIADIQCASIATEIHLSVPVERRQITAGTSYLIHQPMFSLHRGMALNQDELASLSGEIGKTQKEMVSMYANATGMDKVALESLMKQETALTAEQCKEFGFVSEIITPSMQAVALLTPNQKTEDMSKLTEEIKAMRLQIASLVAGQAITPAKVALDVTTNDGMLLVIVTEADVPAVGDGVLLQDGSNAEDGTYDTPMGQIVVLNGVISEYMPLDPNAPVADVTALQAENEALKAENEAAAIALEALKADVTAMAKMQSTYKPRAMQVAFQKKTKEPVEKDGYNSIKEARKAKQAK